MILCVVDLCVCQAKKKRNWTHARHTSLLVCSPSSLFLLPTSAAALIPRMPLMEYEEPAESLVTADTCVAATEVPADEMTHTHIYTLRVTVTIFEAAGN